MKILVGIADFGGRETTPIVKECFKDGVFTVKVFSTVEGDYLFPISIGEGLPFTIRNMFYEERNNYDYFFYTENDIFYSTEVLKNLFDNFGQFGTLHPLGLIRYEEEQLIDFGAVLHGSKIRQISDKWFQPMNDHQASYVLSKHQLHHVIASGAFSGTPSARGGYGMLETGASSPYFEGGLVKTYPLKNLEGLLVKHMDLKWKFLQPRYTLDNLYSDIKQYDRTNL